MVRSVIDSPRLAARLEDGGVAPEQAEAIAKALAEELAGNAGAGARPLDDPEKRGTVIGEVRILKWAVGAAFVALVSALFALYDAQRMTFEKASLAVANQAAANERIVAMDVNARDRIDDLKANTHNQIAALKVDTRNQIAALKADTHDQIAALKADTRDQINALKADTRDRIDDLKAYTRLQVAKSEANTGRRIDSLAARTDERFKGVEKRFDQVDRRFDGIEALLRELLSMQRGEIGSPPGP